LYGRAAHDLSPTDARVQRAWQLKEIVKNLATRTGVDWLGVYSLHEKPGVGSTGHSFLVKEAYIGSPSRAIFPLSPSFISSSNNSKTAATGHATLISDTRKLDPSTPYYECDAKVRSELCVPIFSWRTVNGSDQIDSAASSSPRVVGIIDAESWKAGWFDERKVRQIAFVAYQLGRHHLI